MATSSITANFAIRDEKEAKGFISALLPESRSMFPLPVIGTGNLSVALGR